MQLRKSLGQNFLKDKNYLLRISNYVGDSDSILEIGPGGGALTNYLLRAKRVVAIEKDPRFAELLKGKNHPNLEVIEGDVLDVDLFKLEVSKVVANIPYYITTPIVKKLLFGSNVKEIMLTIQREVAERIVALPGSKRYGLLSLMVQYYGDAELLFLIPPGAFTPPPKVESAFIRIVKRSKYNGDSEKFFKCAKKLFSTRRKTILNNLSAGNKLAVEKELMDLNLDPKLRAEMLTIEQIIEISERLF